MTADPSESTTEAVGTLYDELSSPLLAVMGGAIHVGYWDGPEDDRSVESAGRRMTSLVGKNLAVTGPGKHILDVGCGTGKPARQIAADLNVSVTGITISKNQVEEAQNALKSETQQQEIKFQHADAMKMPFPDASFDGAYAIESLIHMDEPGTAIQQIARVLRTGSRLSIADVFLDEENLNEEGTRMLEQLKEVFQAKTPPSKKNYYDWLSKAGFEVVEFRDVRQNIARCHGLIVDGLRKMDCGGDQVLQAKVDGVAAAMSEMHKLKQLAYTLISAEKK